MQYTKGRAIVSAVDLTARAVQLAEAHLTMHGLKAHVQQANAEQLPFADGTFDIVISSGVLHHTPDTPRAIAECCRVLKNGGEAKLTFYFKGLLHGPFVFPLTRMAMNLLKVRHPGADLAKNAKTSDDFIREYDGEGNPVGVGYTVTEWEAILRNAGFTVESREVHFFPLRFVPLRNYVPRFVHALLDRYAGTMVYFTLRKT